MMAPKNSSTSASSARVKRAFALAAGLVVAANAWIGFRLPDLLVDASLAQHFDLERRIAAFPAKDGVKLLVLGNSHGLAGLRPPLLAKAFGLAPAEVFSLCLIGANARETLLVARRHLKAFPNAKTTVLLVHELLVGQGWADEPGWRYLTRYDPAERAAFLPWVQGLDRRFDVLVGSVIPALDHGPRLRDALVRHPGKFLRALAGQAVEPERHGGSTVEVGCDATFSWLDPPPCASPTHRSDVLPVKFSTLYVVDRAKLITSQLDQAPTGFADLQVLLGWLASQGVRPLLVESPVHPSLAKVLAWPRFQAPERQYQAAYAAFQRQHPVRRFPDPMFRACFYDFDHLSPLGAANMARWLATWTAIPR